MQEIGCEATIERLFQVRSESVRHPTLRCSAIQVGMLCDDGVKMLTIGCDDVLDVGSILQTTLNLKGAGTRLNQLFKMLKLVQILQRQ